MNIFKYLLVGVIIFILPFICYSQDSTIKFERGMTWEQIKAKARAENKFIFIDCFATWCGPCKRMDYEVFSLNGICDSLNKYFVSLKLQMDSTVNDNDNIRKWYSQVSKFQSEYNIKSYPTFLFFSPNGIIVHKENGYKKSADFIEIIKSATDPNKQFYTLLRKYQYGQKDYGKMSLLIKLAMSDYYWEIAREIAEDFKNNYWNHLSEEKLLTKENIEFIKQFSILLSSKDKFFLLLHNRGFLVDSLVHENGLSERLIDYIITKEIVNVKLYKEGNPITTNPDWKNIESTISKEFLWFNMDRTMLNSKIDFYRRISNWEAFAVYRNIKNKKYPPIWSNNGTGSDQWILNSDAWDVFNHSSDRIVLKSAIEWVDFSIVLSPNDCVQYLDTKANLLYKLGDVRSAIFCEREAIKMEDSLSVSNGRPKGSGFVGEYNKTIERMINRIPTWSVPANEDK